MYKRIIAVTSIFILSGCVGAGVLMPDESEAILSPSISSSKGNYSSNHFEKKYTCSYVQEKWGEPDTISAKDNKSTLLYKHDLVWAGVMPILIIPIPLAIPVGSKSTAIECNNDVVIKAYGTRTTFYGGYCGVISSKPEYGCDSD